MPFIPSALLIAAICSVESGGDRHAVNGSHWGIMQIEPRVVIDVNDYLADQGRKLRYGHEDAFDPVRSEQMFRIYCRMWLAPERIGHPPTDCDAAMLWRFGPEGMLLRWNRPERLRYWMRVQNAMDIIGPVMRIEKAFGSPAH